MTDQAFSLGPLRPPATDVAAYRELRAAGRAVTRRLTKTIPPRAHKAMGEALGLWSNGQLRFPFPEAAAALTEACILDWIENRRTPAESYMGRVRGGEAIAPAEREALLSMVKGCCELMQITRQWAGVGIAMDCVSDPEDRIVMDESLGDLPDAHGTWVAARYTFVRGFWMTLGTPLVLGKGNDLKMRTYAEQWDEIRMFGDCHHKAALLLMRMGLDVLKAQAGDEHRPGT